MGEQTNEEKAAAFMDRYPEMIGTVGGLTKLLKGVEDIGRTAEREAIAKAFICGELTGDCCSLAHTARFFIAKAIMGRGDE